MKRALIRALLGVAGLIVPEGLSGGDIHDAVTSGNVAKVRALLTADSSLASAPQGTAATQPLHLAAAAGKTDAMVVLLDAGAAIGAADRAGWTALHSAAHGLQREATALLLTRGADVDAKTAEGLTPLRLAIGPVRASEPRHDDAQAVGVVSLLLEGGASPSQADPDGYATPLDDAVCQDLPLCAAALLKAGAPADPPRADPRHPLALSPLGRAAMLGAARTAKVLIEHGACVDGGNPRLAAPVALAALLGQKEILVMLLDAGAQPVLPGPGRSTCLHTLALVPSWSHTRCASAWRDVIGQLLRAIGSAAETPGDAAPAISSEASAAAVKALGERSAALDRPVDYRGCAQALLDYGLPVDVTGARRVTALQFASKTGNLEAVRFLLEHGAQATCRDRWGFSALEYATEAGQTAAVRLLAGSGADLKGSTTDGRTALHLAAARGSAELVTALLAHQPDLEARDAFGETPLQKASLLGRIEAARLLVQAGARVTSVNRHGRAPLHGAAMGRSGALQALEEQRRRPGAETYRTGPGPGDEADYRALAELLIDKGADVTAKDSKSETPLCVAAFTGNEPVLRLLVEKGADVGAKGPDEATPLHLAAHRGSQPAVQLLLDRGADVRARNRYGNTPLHTLAYGAGNPEVAQLLLAAGADLEARNNDGEPGNGQTPLSAAAAGGHVALTQLLLARGADVAAVDGTGATPLHWAALKGHAETVRLLLDGGAPTRVKDRAGATPAAHCVFQNRLECLTLIHQRDATVLGVQGENGVTLLHVAAGLGHADIVRFLLGQGLKPDARDSAGVTPLHAAAQRLTRADLEGMQAQAEALLGRPRAAHTRGPGSGWAVGASQAEAAAALLDAGAQIEARAGPAGDTPLRIACGQGNIEVARVLLEHGADAMLRAPQYGELLIHNAADYGQADLVKLFLEHGVGPGVRDRLGTTPLHYASQSPFALPRQFLEVAALLSTAGADVNARMTKGGHTPLHRAVDTGNHYLAESLVFHGANATGADPGAGESPLQMAVRKSDKAMVAVLAARGLFPHRHVLRLGLGDKRSIVAVVNGDAITASDAIAYAGGPRALFEADSVTDLQDPDRLPAILDRVHATLAGRAHDLVALRLQHWACASAGVQVPAAEEGNAAEEVRRRLRLPPGQLFQGSAGTGFEPGRVADQFLGKGLLPAAPLQLALRRLDWTVDDFRRVCTWLAAARQYAIEVIDPEIEITEPDIRQAYEEDLRCPPAPQELRLQLITLADQAAGEALLAQLREGADFTALARRHSTHASAGKGGDQGWLQTGSLRAELSGAFTEFRPGAIAGPVSLDGKVYLLRVSDVKAAARPALAEAAQAIRQRLHDAERERRRAQLIEALRQAADIEWHLESP